MLRWQYERQEGFESLGPEPVSVLRDWLGDATAAGMREPTAMTIATADAAGQPSARIVLLRGLDQRGLVFYTSYESQKGRELAQNPRGAAVLYWEPLMRQVRVVGTVARLPTEESAAYFATRPAGSRRAAWASAQSTVIRSREALEERFRQMESRFPDDDVPLPPFWGGYRLTPATFEFWAGRENRLHDRLRYRRDADAGWIRERLSP